MTNLSGLRQIHCIGIGGIGLSAIGQILLARGYTVTGSDVKESEVIDKLIANGAKIFLGHRAKNVEGADLIIYSAAVTGDNPELVRASELGIPIISRAEILGTLMQEYENSIAISGTHGKTTTTSMVSLILDKAGKCPTILVGGNLSEIGGNVKVGSGDYFVTEACEYMDSFLSLRPRIEIILNIDSDHLDYFKDIDHIVRSFREFAHLTPAAGKIIAYDSNPFVKTAVADMPNVISFGLNEASDYSATDIFFDSSGMPQFFVKKQGEVLSMVRLSVPGEHNILNALAAFACCFELGVELSAIVETLENYKGTQRRFDIIGITRRNIKLVDDYAHHPTEIKATLDAAQNLPHRRLWCLFQPHTYTRTLALFNEFADAFQRADIVILSKIYAAREKNVYGISSKDLLEEMKGKYPTKPIYYLDTFEEIADFVMEHGESEDLVITMGAGDIYKVAERILEKDWE